MHYCPEWKGPIQGYVVNYIKRNYWRVESTQCHSDLMQEAFIVFMRIGLKYPEMDTPQHFMALFKTAWSRHFTDLANADSQERANTIHIWDGNENPGEISVEEMVGDRDNDGALATMLRQAPHEVTAVINLFLSAPQELLDLALGAWNGPDQRCRAGGSEKINKLLGLPPDGDALQAVRDYFH